MATSGGGGGTGDVQAGGAYVRIYSKDDLTKTLDRLRARFNSFGKFLNDVGTKLTVAGAGILAPITALFAGGVNRAAQVGKLAEQYGVSAEQMSRFAFAAEDAGVSLEEVIANQERFAATLARAPVFDTATAKDAIETQRLLKDGYISLQVALLPLLQVIAPIVKQFADFVRENSHLVIVAASVGAGLLALAAAAKVVALGVALVTAAMTALKLATVFLSPGGLLIAGIAAVGAAMIVSGGGVKQLGEDFREMGATAMEAWSGIVALLKKGDLEGAADIAFAAIETLWHQLIVSMGKAFDAWFKQVFGRFAMLAKVIAFVGGGALAGAAFGGLPGAAIGAGVGALALYLKETTQAASELALPAARGRLRELTRKAIDEPGIVTKLGESSINARLNAANTKGGFGGPLAQQFGIGDTFQKRLLAATEESNGFLKGIFEELKKGGFKFS